MTGQKNNGILNKQILCGPGSQSPTVNIFLGLFCSHRCTKDCCFSLLIQGISSFNASTWCPRFYEKSMNHVGEWPWATLMSSFSFPLCGALKLWLMFIWMLVVKLV